MIEIPFVTKRYIPQDWCLTSPFGPAVREPVRELTCGQMTRARELFLGLYRRSTNGSTRIEVLNGIPGVSGAKTGYATQFRGPYNIHYQVNLMNGWWERVYQTGISACACKMITHAVSDGRGDNVYAVYRCCWIKQPSRNIALSLQPGWICKHRSGAMARSCSSAHQAYKNLVRMFDNMRRTCTDEEYNHILNSRSFNDWHRRELPHDHPHSY